jgi:hypothetical protein
MLLFLHRQLVFMEQLMGKKFVLKLRLWGRLLGLTCQKWEAAADQFEKIGNTYRENTHRISFR